MLDVPAGASQADWLRVQRFVEATGDENPLYLDPRHGARSAWRTMLAPPAFVLAVAVPDSAGALRRGPVASDALPLLTRIELGWSDQIRLGDRLQAEVTTAGAEAGEVVTEATYRREGAPFATARGTVTLLEGDRIAERGIHRYEDAEIAELVGRIEAEPPRRGTRPRLFEEVTPGEPLPELVKGPLSWSDLIAWIIAEARPVKATNLLHRELLVDPARARPHPVTGWPVWEAEQAREDLAAAPHAGLPAPLARGSMLAALAGQLATHWMGDDAFLRGLGVTLGEPLLYGDTLLLSGRVEEAFEGPEGEGCARLEIDGRNQLGSDVVSGEAVVLLPRRGAPVRVPVGR